MPNINTGPTEMVQWFELVKEAQSSYGIVLQEDLEHYLIILLQRFATNPAVVTSLMATEFLQSRGEHGYLAQQQLREVGDKCLLFAGLYPECASQRRVPIRYFIDLGRTSYHCAADCVHQPKVEVMFKQLADKFVSMMDVMHCLRELAGAHQQLSMEQALELFQDVGSEHARQLLQQHKGSVPLQQIFGVIKGSH